MQEIVEILKSLSTKFNLWWEPFVIVGVTLICSTILRPVLTLIFKKEKLKAFQFLVPGIIGLFLVIGFSIAVDFAPVSTKGERWLESILYVATVFILFRMAHLFSSHSL